MSVAVINYHRGMSRWQPDPQGRLAQAALELYVERGYEQTTVAEIARPRSWQTLNSGSAS
jgi:hypothetical protein